MKKELIKYRVRKYIRDLDIRTPEVLFVLAILTIILSMYKHS